VSVAVFQEHANAKGVGFALVRAKLYFHKAFQASFGIIPLSNNVSLGSASKVVWYRVMILASDEIL